MDRASVSLHRLLNRRETTRLLENFCLLLPQATIALIENDGRVFVETGCPSTDQDARLSDYALPFHIANETIGTLVIKGPELNRAEREAAIHSLHHSLTLLLSRALENRSLAQETLERYREINLLYNIGETINTCLDSDKIPHLVLKEAARIIHADAGAVLLRDQEDMLVIRSHFAPPELEETFHAIISPHFDHITHDQAHILTSDQLTDQPTPVGAISWAPFKTQEQVLGGILLARTKAKPVFTAGDEKLLVALATQAAIAIENAGLFADVKRQRDAIGAMKNQMDNIFASIASGVVTIDDEGLITTLNKAAERILALKAENTIGQPYVKILPRLGRKIISLINVVKRKEEPVRGYELEIKLPDRGKVVLRLHISPLKDSFQKTSGVTIVLNDLTERRQLEQQVQQVRETFERYVVPGVVEQLLSDPSRVQLGGVQQDVSVLFADLRNFSAFSEKLEPEAVVEVLNQHLTLAVEAVLAEEGMLDKFIGDAIMAVFNAPLPQPNHTLRTVRAALTMQQTINKLHTRLPPTEQLSFGVGIATGQVVVGNIGSPTIHDYTAIGDSVNMAWRLHKHAGPGQILLNETAYKRVQRHVIVKELGLIPLKGHSRPDLVFEVLSLQR